ARPPGPELALSEPAVAAAPPAAVKDEPESLLAVTMAGAVRRPDAPAMQNTCPSCGAMYNLTAQHVGRHFACKKCGAALAVGPTGVEREGGPDQALSLSGESHSLALGEEPASLAEETLTAVVPRPAAPVEEDFDEKEERLSKILRSTGEMERPSP